VTSAPRPPRPPDPSEEHIQFALARVLDELGVLWCHPPNEGQAVDVRPGGRPSPEQRSRLLRSCQLVALGVKAGVPDVLIFTPPTPPSAPPGPGQRGVALELKTRAGRPSAAQERWLKDLAAAGWHASVEHGFEAAVARLEALGYDTTGALARCQARGEGWDGTRWRSGGAPASGGRRQQ